ncbi:MAG: cupin domain-containing protein, partial [Phycisphaeraceae bacterium JB051]
MRRSTRQYLPQLRFAGEHAGNGDVAFHEHPVPELILLVEGECRTETSAEQFHSQPGDLLCMPAGVSHNQIDFGKVRTLYVGFESPRFEIKQPCQFRLSCRELVEHSLWMLFQIHTRRWGGTESAAG